MLVKTLKRILKIALISFSVLIGVLLITILIAMGLDARNTSYLKIKPNDPAGVDSYLLTHVNVIPMTRDTILQNKMVYINAGIIQSIEDHIEAPGVEVIDGQNQFLTPGLIDMHVHVWDRYELGLYLANGVTGIRNLWGMPMHLRIKEDIQNGKLLAPSFFTTGPKLTGPEFIGDDNLQLNSPEEGREKVISYKKRGYDFIKTYYGLTEDIFDAIVEQAREENMDIVAHPSQKVPYSYHFNSQIKSIEHAEDIIQQPLNYTLDTVKLKEAIDDFQQSKHTSFCPTLVVYNNIYQMLIDDEILQSPDLQCMNPLIKRVDSQSQFDRWYNTKLNDPTIVNSTKDQHDFHLDILRRLHEVEVNIICGTDAGIGVTIPGYSIHQELAFYKEAGLSNYEVLKTATANPAQTHQMISQMGTIEVGKMANLILVKENPLLDLSTLEKPTTVFIGGKKLDRATLDKFEHKARDRNNLLASLVRYVENLLVEKVLG